MTDLGEITGTWILGMHVTRDHNEGWIVMSQINEVLERFEKPDIRLISMSALAIVHLIKLTSSQVDVKAYQHAVGPLMCAMLGTRPDRRDTCQPLHR
jgi:hypothetical protein